MGGGKQLGLLGGESAKRSFYPGGFTLHMTGYAPAYTKSLEKGSFFRHTAASTSFAKRVYFWLLTAI